MAEHQERKSGQEERVYVTKENTQIKLRQIGTEAPLPKDVEHWMHEVKKVVGDHQSLTMRSVGQAAPAATTTNSKITIPTTREVFSAGFKKKVNDVGRWLSTFLFRMMKIKHEEVVFKDDNV